MENVSSKVLAACVVDKVSLWNQQVVKKEVKSKAEARHSKVFTEMMCALWSTRVPHVKKGRA